MPDSDKPVVFLLEDGTEISNDPRWKAAQFADQLDRQNAVWEAQAQAAARQEAKLFAEKAGEGEDDVEEDDGGDHSGSDFSGLTINQLKSEAAERDIDLKKAGVKTKTDLIALLEEHDAKK
jgi:hypothetical protein